MSDEQTQGSVDAIVQAALAAAASDGAATLEPDADAESAVVVETQVPPPAESDPVELATFDELASEPSVGARHGDADLALVLDVPVDLVVEIGRTRMTIRETLAIGKGSMITLDKLAGEPADLLVNGKLIARGEVVAIDEEFGFRVTEVVAAA